MTKEQLQAELIEQLLRVMLVCYREGINLGSVYHEAEQSFNAIVDKRMSKLQEIVKLLPPTTNMRYRRDKWHVWHSDNNVHTDFATYDTRMCALLDFDARVQSGTIGIIWNV